MCALVTGVQTCALPILFLPEDDPDSVNAKLPWDPIDRFIWANLRHAVTFNGSKRFHPQGHMTDYFADEAIEAIEANRNRPFFLYLAFNAPHTPPPDRQNVVKGKRVSVRYEPGGRRNI